MSVALNPSTPGIVRIKLRHRDSDSNVREYDSRSLSRKEEKAPPRGEDQEVTRYSSQASSGETNINSKHIEKMLKNIFDIGLSGLNPSSNRRFLFTLPQCPANVLAKNFRSRSWLERFAIAGNPSTPEVVLERMANEGNQLVRRAAASNLARRASAAEPQLIQEQSSA